MVPSPNLDPDLQPGGKLELQEGAGREPIRHVPWRLRALLRVLISSPFFSRWGFAACRAAGMLASGFEVQGLACCEGFGWAVSARNLDPNPKPTQVFAYWFGSNDKPWRSLVYSLEQPFLGCGLPGLECRGRWNCLHKWVRTREKSGARRCGRMSTVCLQGRRVVGQLLKYQQTAGAEKAGKSLVVWSDRLTG